ncbi:MAG: 1-deoxy-D-xylulose-5-phosphate reductoisomerase [Planctomycetes bacterium]|nr:1-deoxy-D-xylulose-5-phosphate reductoisomerase [Planctomycetota bacterium]
MRRVLVLGSTGSIGAQALALLAEELRRMAVVGLSAQRSAEALLEQVRTWRPPYAALVDAAAAERVRERWPSHTRLFSGPDALLELIEAAPCEVVLNGIVGSAGLRPSVEILRAGRTLALANKESLVVAGAELMELAERHAAAIVPVDSEHSAIFQCLAGAGARADARRVRRVYLTASGGALRDLPLEEMPGVTPERALAHPNWNMGPRITIGSATLMNKALEVIEAHHLFGLRAEQIEVLLHRQSIVHSMVEFVDGSLLAQMGPPDMRAPIHYALHWPERTPSALVGFEPRLFQQLTFAPADAQRYPALELGFACVRRGGISGAVLNAADEVAVEAFLQRSIDFDAIQRLNRHVLDALCPAGAAPERGGIEAGLRADARARQLARQWIERSDHSPQASTPAWTS